MTPPDFRPARASSAGTVLALALWFAWPSLAAQTTSSSDWRALTPAQQSALAPLQPQWASIDAARRDKWLDVARRFPTMPPEERSRVQERMAQWSHLKPSERGQARVQFQEAQRWSPEARQARWDEYQSLHPDARRVLAERWKLDAAARKAIRAEPSASKRNVVESPVPPVMPNQPASPTTVRARVGATSTLVSPKPAAPGAYQSGVPKIAATEAFVDPATLLPRRGPQAAAMVPLPRRADDKAR